MIEFAQATVVVAAATPDGVTPRVILEPITATFVEDRVAVLGANGSGKSTLARLINALTLPSAGAVRVNSLDTRKSGAEVRRHVGFLFADATAQIIMPTPIEDVAMSLRRLGVPRKDRNDRALEILDRFGLVAQAYQPVHTLSGGQTQLLALAAVLALEPRVLVCDEPTTRLDLVWREVLIQALLELPTQLVLVTHDLELAAQCDRAIVMDDGKMVTDDTAASAVTQYRDLVKAKVSRSR